MTFKAQVVDTYNTQRAITLIGRDLHPDKRIARAIADSLARNVAKDMGTGFEVAEVYEVPNMEANA